ncbi:MAG: SDR family NAD(P)-dependent oxidoreductase [Acutalibacteraceae bacterium]
MMKKSVLVTGATSGTGIAIAERFAKEGYDVFITSRDIKKAEQCAKDIATKYNCFAKGYELDAKSENQVIDMFEDIRSNGCLIDTVVLNAANLGINMKALETSYDEFMEVINTNMGWNFCIAREAAKQMKEKNKGSIVFITSNTAYRAIPDRCAYSASKSGIIGLSRALAVDLGKYGIRSNCVLPGMIKTTRWESNFNNCKSALSNYTPIGDIAEFEDIANAAWYFGSDESRNTTGAELTVDGGNMIQLYPQIDK